MGALPEQHTQGDVVSIARTLAQSFLNVLPDPAWVKDTAGRYAAINPAYRKMFEALTRRTPSEIIGRTDFDLFSSDEAEAIRRQESEIMAERAARHLHQVPPRWLLSPFMSNLPWRARR